ncbi:uncharacterized protein LOC113466152 [Diaphorina citri]|uniref:Uncharacterized protein LOC113466152 n=1 Tax=Diaphorina citri TaxID=121845 RepID=A0A3Q0IRY8_DIACI|nr:uncharacterized protein LOC113466152 [Diaphorina citri]
MDFEVEIMEVEIIEVLLYIDYKYVYNLMSFAIVGIVHITTENCKSDNQLLLGPIKVGLAFNHLLFKLIIRFRRRPDYAHPTYGRRFDSPGAVYEVRAAAGNGCRPLETGASEDPFFVKSGEEGRYFIDTEATIVLTALAELLPWEC